MADSGESTIIANETHIKGELRFDGQARIVGSVEGKIVAHGDLIVAEQGTCKAEIDAENVQVDGAIEGDVKAGQRIQLNSKGRIQGDIVAQKLVTAEGAAIVGHVNVGPSAGQAPAKDKAASSRAPDPAKAVEAAVTK